VSWRRAFVVITFVFAILNVVNQCSPGYCGRYGFPFAYRWWSDAVLIINGTNVGAGRDPTALWLNAATYLSSALIMALIYRVPLRRR
jgi:hypothetical protein